MVKKVAQKIIKKIGDSLYILIDSEEAKIKNLNQGDIVDVLIKKIERRRKENGK